MSSQRDEAYKSLMRGLNELDITGPYVPSVLDLIGDKAFPLAMNSHGQILMAASTYGAGRIVVLGHEGYLTTFPTLTENAVAWLKGDGPYNPLVGVHQTIQEVADNLNASCIPAKVVSGFSKDLGLGVFVAKAYSVDGEAEELVEFLKKGGGILIAGQAWSWAYKNRGKSTILHFVGNQVSSVAGIYFSRYHAAVEPLSVEPQIPFSWKSLAVRENFKDDLEVLLQGISEFNFKVDKMTLCELLVHGLLAFPIGATPDGRTFLAGAYYGKGRVVVVTHDILLAIEWLAPLWKNVMTWLDRGRNGITGVAIPNAYSLFAKSGINCQQTDLRKDLSVYVCKAYTNDIAEELQEFVAEGGGLLVAGQSWYWAQTNKSQNVLTDYPGNKFMYNMGMSFMSGTIRNTVYPVPDPSRDIKETYHLRHMIHRFVAHATHGSPLSMFEEGNLKKLGIDCAAFLQMEAHHCASYSHVLDVLTDLVKTCGMPQMSESTPVTGSKAHALLHVGAALYRVYPDRDALLPHLIKSIPSLPVVHNTKVTLDVNTAGGSEMISTGLYLTPCLETSIVVPEQIVNKNWMILIGCQTDFLKKDLLKRPPIVCERIYVKAQMMTVSNMYGGLIYLMAPPHTRMDQVEITVQVAVQAPYYKFGVTTEAEWLTLRSAPAPWAELEFENIIFSVPSEVVRELDKPDELAALWNAIMRAVADLAATSPKFSRKERFVTEVQITHGVMHAGYPIMALYVAAPQVTSIDHIMTKGLWPPIHELGHNQQRDCWEFKYHTTEATCNIWSVYVHEEVLKIPRAQAYRDLTPERRKANIEKFVRRGKRLDDYNYFIALETYLQLQEKFGWNAFKKVFGAYHKMTRFPTDKNEKMNLYTETFSEAVGMNLCGFMKAWSWPICSTTEKKLSSLPPWNDHPMVQYM
ncbi:TRPM8 channel-associated factor homolog [Synchiropus splendidus]|uniref:TRPM8 channel-associated factor homolog n=1 Tax=Synchiropus splendidus TaxID=270530 RepID=UPI00237EC519|nr:TRPM8 channel-associated factor homolog [Synchiropus splendidus]